MARRAAGGAGGGAELGAGLARVGWLEDFAAATRCILVARRFAWVGAIGQRFRAVHFVEMGLWTFEPARLAHSSPRTLSTVDPPSKGRNVTLRDFQTSSPDNIEV